MFRHVRRIRRVHLHVRRSLRALDRHDDGEDGEAWALRLAGLGDLIVVSRRMLPAVREAFREQP